MFHLIMTSLGKFISIKTHGSGKNVILRKTKRKGNGCQKFKYKFKRLFVHCILMLKYEAKPYILTTEYNSMHINCPLYDMI